MLFLLGGVFIIAAYFSLRRDVANAKLADRLFYFGLFLITSGIIFMCVLVFLKHRH